MGIGKLRGTNHYSNSRIIDRYEEYVHVQEKAWVGFEAVLESIDPNTIADITNTTSCRNFRVFRKLFNGFQLTYSNYDSSIAEPCSERYKHVVDTSPIKRVDTLVQFDSSPITSMSSSTKLFLSWVASRLLIN
jgi:hypothetical protein